jgi:hypothetical protein
MAVKSLLTTARSARVAGQAEFTTPGTFQWTCPPGVTSVSVVAVGVGGYAGSGHGGGGGELRYKNDIPVVPGTLYTVVVAAASSTSKAGSTSFNVTSCVAMSGSNGTVSGALGGSGGVGDGGGNGGKGAAAGNTYGSGGGAGGYSGNGGDGANNGSPYSTGGPQGQPGQGGAGSGGSSGQNTYLDGGGGGGVGLLGQGASGTGRGVGGSGGESGTTNTVKGGDYGGGMGGNTSVNGSPGKAAVRIIWPGNKRKFPDTRTANEYPDLSSYAKFEAWVTAQGLAARSGSANLASGTFELQHTAMGVGSMYGSPLAFNIMTQLSSVSRVLQHAYPEGSWSGTLNQKSIGRFTASSTSVFYPSTRNGYTSLSSNDGTAYASLVMDLFIYWDVVLGKAMMWQPLVGSGPVQFLGTIPQ